MWSLWVPPPGLRLQHACWRSRKTSCEASISTPRRHDASDAAVSLPLLLVARMTCLLRTLPRRLRWSPSWRGKCWSSCASIATPPSRAFVACPRVACPRVACPRVACPHVACPRDARRRTPLPRCDRCSQLPRGHQRLPGWADTNQCAYAHHSLGCWSLGKLKSKIWANEFVDFVDLTHPVPQQPHLISGQSGESHLVSIMPQTRVRQISAIDQWTSAFLVFGAVYTRRFPDSAPGIFKYAEIVRDIALTGPPFAWRQYDSQFRTLRQADPVSFPWEQSRWDLFFRCMYAKPFQGGLVVRHPLS